MHRYWHHTARLVALLLMLVAAGPPALAAPAAAASAGALPWYPRTLVQADGTTAFLAAGWLGTSGAWVVYTRQQQGCGHCGTYQNGIELINVRDTRRRSIRTATSGNQDGQVQGIFTTRFRAPYLLWEQPGAAMGPGYGFNPGDYTCSICQYNVDTGQGDPALAVLDIAPATSTSLHVLDLDAAGRALVLQQTFPEDQLWIVDLRAGTRQQIAFIPEEINVREGVLFRDQAAWLEGSILMAAGPGTPRHTVTTNAQRPRGTLFSLFWYAPGGIYTDALGPAPHPVVPGGSPMYDVVDTSGGLGRAVAWALDTPGGPGRADLVLTRLDGTVLLHQTVAAPVTTLSLDGDKLAYLTAPPGAGPAGAAIQLAWLGPPNPAFGTVWAKADAAVAAGTAPRSWLWGPTPRYAGQEAYAQGPGGVHQVLYYDKARMEVNNPAADLAAPGYVTNGLLAVEMIGGAFQVGNAATITASVPCTIPVAGDPRKDNPLTPDYAALAGVASLHGDHEAPSRIGQPVVDAIDVHGIVSADPAHGALARYAAFAPQTGHNVPDVFWTYLQGMPATYGYDWTFVLGYPIMEAYWTQMRVAGRTYPVLIQAYQRRVLTYVPDFAPVWQVQQGNVGQHYLEWRYTLNP